jgi:dihydrodipicolinate synthase/N-acetylneuraminate lyase
MRHALEGIGGSLVVLPTPFRDTVIVEAALRGLVERQIAGGTVALLVACGSTGEASALTEIEAAQVVGLVARAAAGRVRGLSVRFQMPLAFELDSARGLDSA